MSSQFESKAPSRSLAAGWRDWPRAALLPTQAYLAKLFERVRSGWTRVVVEPPGTGEVVDNCQHVLLGCCTNLIDFYHRLGVEQQIRWYDEITFILPGGKSSTLKPGDCLRRCMPRHRSSNLPVLA